MEDSGSCDRSTCPNVGHEEIAGDLFLLAKIKMNLISQRLVSAQVTSTNRQYWE